MTKILDTFLPTLTNKLRILMDAVVEQAQSHVNDDDSVWSKAMRAVLSKMELTAKVQYPAQAEIDHVIVVPLKETLKVPIEANVHLNTWVETMVTVPLDIELSGTDLTIGKMAIDIDQTVEINDEIEIDINQLLDSMVDLDQSWINRIKSSLPLKKTAKLRINQPLKIKSTLNPTIDSLKIHLKKDVAIKLLVPIDQTVNVKGHAKVSIDQQIAAPIHSTVPVTIDQPLQIQVLDIKIK